MKKFSTLILTLQFFLIAFVIKAQNKKEEIDPSKLTNLYSSCNISTEYTTGEDLKLYGIRASISYSPNADNLLVFEVPLINNGNTSKFGLGDMRVRYFTAVKRDISPMFIAVAPFIDITIPSGKFENGLGSSSWLLSAGGVIGLVFSEKLSLFPGLGLIYSTKPGTDLIPDNMKTSSAGLGFQFNISYTINKTTYAFINPTPTILNTNGIWKANWAGEISLSEMVVKDKFLMNAYWGPNFTDKTNSFRLGGTFYL